MSQISGVSVLGKENIGQNGGTSVSPPEEKGRNAY